MNATSIVELLCVGLALWATWLSLRPTPSLDWERLWKITLATIIRGEVEGAGGDLDAWWARLAPVPYHPAGREAEAKLGHPDLETIPVPALEGERVLVGQLVTLDTPAQRWQAMFVESEAAQDALQMDPTDLGPAYDPSRVAGPDVTWDSIAAWNDVVQVSLSRRLEDVIVVAAGFDGAALQAAVPHGRVRTLGGDALSGIELAPHERMVVISEADSTFAIVQALHADASLRDRVRMVVALGADLGRDERAEWMETHFTQAAMDTEINRQTPYMAVIDVDSSDPLAHKWADQRFPSPPVLPSGWEPIESVDLGPLNLEALDPAIVGRALWVLLAFCLADR